MKSIFNVLILMCFILLLSSCLQVKLDEEQTQLFKEELGHYLDGAIEVSETGESNKDIQYNVPITDEFTKLSPEEQQLHFNSLRSTFSKQQIHCDTNKDCKLTEIRLQGGSKLEGEKATYILYLD